MNKILISATTIALLLGSTSVWAQRDQNQDNHTRHGDASSQGSGASDPSNDSQKMEQARARDADHAPAQLHQSGRAVSDMAGAGNAQYGNAQRNNGHRQRGTAGGSAMNADIAARNLNAAAAQSNGDARNRHANSSNGGTATASRADFNGSVALPNNDNSNRRRYQSNRYNRNAAFTGNVMRTSHGNIDIARYERNVSARHHFSIGSYRAPRGYHYRHFSYGERLPQLYFARDYWLSDYGSYDLIDPPDGLVWVRYGDDALLVEEDTGDIVQVQYNVFA